MITTTNNDETLVLTIEATELDATNGVVIRQALQEAIEAPGGDVAVDLGQVGLIDSAGVGVLLAVSKYNKKPIALINAKPNVLAVLKLLRLQKLFKIQGA